MKPLQITKSPTLTAAPINPKWILYGNPVARGALMSETDDESVATYMWDCTDGTFIWRYDVDEVVHILEGSVTILDTVTFIQYELKQGDSVLFHKGTLALWSVEKYVRKLAVLHSPLPKKYLLLKRIWNMLKGTNGKRMNNLAGAV